MQGSPRGPKVLGGTIGMVRRADPMNLGTGNMDLQDAVRSLTRHGRLLRERFHYDWSRQAEEAGQSLLFQLGHRLAGSEPGHDATGRQGDVRGGRRLSLVAIVGGASSGKSTVFNNLLGGRLASRVTAKGHATRGPIAAVHELQRDVVEEAFEAEVLMPAFSTRVAGLDDDTEGEPGILHVLYHNVDALRDVVLLDMPDSTSELARMEGDIALATLPWFDRLIVMVDHERWFDRQTIGRLRDESSQFGQDRFVVFNRGKEGRLSQGELARLKHQADRLGAVDHLVLEFRRGRGCCTFPPNTLDSVLNVLNQPARPREQSLVRFLGRLAAVVLNNNNERRARLAQLHHALDRAATSAVPSPAECFAALMTADERRHLDVISRTLRIVETRQWLARQADRIKQTLHKRIPVVGHLFIPGRAAESGTRTDTPDRQAIGRDVFRSRCTRQLGAIDDAATGSDFWTEVRRWKAVDVPCSSPDLIGERRDAVRSAIAKLGEAIEAWTAKVESECRGASPRLIGAVGAASIAGAIVLVAVSGPVGALTLPAVKVALGGALGALATSAGAGAIAGPSLVRLLTVVHEKLLGSPEFRAVQSATDEYREIIAACGRDAANKSFATAQALVLAEEDELARALTTLCDAAETD